MGVSCAPARVGTPPAKAAPLGPGTPASPVAAAKPKPALTAGVSQGPVPESTPPVKPVPAVQPKPPKPSPPPQAREAETPPPQVSIAQFVSKGRFVGASAGEQIFQSHSADPGVQPALFEDAIILNRVRGALKATSPEFAVTAAQARVSGGVISLSLPPGTGARQAAAAVDAALAVEGVRAVRTLVP